MPIEDATDSALAYVMSLVRACYGRRRDMEKAEAVAKQAKIAYLAISEHELPEAMALVGMAAPTRTTLAGLYVELTRRYRCGQLEYPTRPRASKSEDVPRAKDPLAALQWFDEEGHGDLPRRTITVTLGKDSTELAEELAALLRSHRAANQFDVRVQRIIPSQTLGAFARSQVEEGYDPPLDLLGVQEITQAKVTMKVKEDDDV